MGESVQHVPWLWHHLIVQPIYRTIFEFPNFSVVVQEENVKVDGDWGAQPGQEEQDREQQGQQEEDKRGYCKEEQRGQQH